MKVRSNGYANLPAWPRWLEDPPPEPLEPGQIAGLYRALRKGREDSKDEPGAADFYYGEMEMRRHARTTPTAEHAIIWLYWLISGYGLRALRSLAALVFVGVVATVALIGWLTSWAMEAVSSPSVVTRVTCASSACALRSACSA